MSKPPPAKSDKTKKASAANRPQMPFASVQRAGSGRSPYGSSSATQPAKAARPAQSPSAHAGKSKPKAPAKPASFAAAKPATPKPAGQTKFLVGKDPVALINRRAADRLRSGYPWVYATDLDSVTLAAPGDHPALLPVADQRGLLLGTALYSPVSLIALRIVAREAIGEGQWLALLAARLRAAIQRRKPLLSAETNSCRLCFSEADQLPGLIVDKYGDLIILQLLAKGLDSPAVRAACVEVLRQELSPAAIWERPDARIRELEGLSAPASEPLWKAEPDAATAQTGFRLNGLNFHFDANSGQKTGAFLDQRANYAAARDWAVRLGATGRALDVCTYQGGFALHLAQACRSVVGIDASRASLEVAERNFADNKSALAADVEWVEADAFQILRDWSDAGEKFDTIVLDPPAFAKTKRAVEGALRGYKELNLRALRMAKPAGLLVTSSCSHHVSWADLESAVASAAVDASRRVRLLERRGACIDHPVVLNLPETEYLKCLVLEVE